MASQTWPKKTDSDEIGGFRSVRRALGILELVMERGKPVAITDIIATLSIPKSTAYELVHTLTETGYLSVRDQSKSLFLGRKVFELGMAYRSQADLVKDGAEIVEELRDKTGETVQLSVLDGLSMLVLLKEEGMKPLRIISKVGSRVPVNWAAAGRLLVSDLDEPRLRVFLNESVRPSPSGRATTDIDTLVREIYRFRKRGFGTEVNEANEHAGCVAAPVIGSSGRCVAAISIVVPAQRMAKVHREQLIRAVQQAAEELSRRMGG
jgi:IclR family transcriptional regulator, KDG regulon repressor